jgi:hypothetical protein
MSEHHAETPDEAQERFRFNDISLPSFMVTGIAVLPVLSESTRDVLHLMLDAVRAGEMGDVGAGIAFMTVASLAWGGGLKAAAWAIDNIPGEYPDTASRKAVDDEFNAYCSQVVRAPVGLVRKALSFASSVLERMGGWLKERRELNEMVAKCDEMIIEKGTDAAAYMVFDASKRMDVGQEVWSSKAKVDRLKKLMVQSGKPLIERHIHQANGDMYIKEMTTVWGRPDSGSTYSASVRSWLSTRDGGTQLLAEAWHLHGSPVPPAVAVGRADIRNKFGRSGREARLEFDREAQIDLIQPVSASPSVQPENFSCAVEVEFLASPEGSNAAKDGYPYQIMVSPERGWAAAAVGFVTASEAAALRTELAKTDILVSEQGKPTMQRGQAHDRSMERRTL